MLDTGDIGIGKLLMVNNRSRPGQKKPCNPNQSDTDPNGDLPAWNIPKPSNRKPIDSFNPNWIWIFAIPWTPILIFIQKYELR